MNEREPSKFDNKFDITYLGLFKTRFEIMTGIINEFGKDMGKEKAVKIASKFTEAYSVKDVEKIVENYPVNNFQDFKNVFMGLMSSDYFKTTTTLAITENTDKKLSWKCTECLWAKVFKDLNETEAGYNLVCNADFAMAKAFHPKVTMARTKTLMQGDDHCDAHYTWDD